MKVIVNATPLLAPLTGIGQYIRHLFTAMDRQGKADIRMFYGTSFKKGITPPGAGQTKLLQRGHSLLQRFVPRPRTLRRVVEKAMFNYMFRSGSRDTVYHEPNYVALPFKGQLVLTVCDLSCFDHPETHPKERVDLMQRDMPASIARADHIIVISEATSVALQHWFKVDPARISTTYLAADARFMPRPPETLRPALAQFGLTPQAYVLCVGTLEPRKNLSTLFAAYAGLPVALRQRFPLVVAGMAGWRTEGLMQSAADLISSQQVRLLGYVPDDVMPLLYAGAAAFCYPSRYEGFGLPPLEAMACGVPVLTSNRTSLPEVVGDAGLMVGPDDVDGMRERLRQMLEDEAFAQALGQRGLLRSRLFTWERCAQETFAVYEKVLQQRSRR